MHTALVFSHARRWAMRGIRIMALFVVLAQIAPTVTPSAHAASPTLNSFMRQNPATSSTNADTLAFRATFSDNVQNVDTADFVVAGTTATITNITAVNAKTYDITVSGGNLANLNGTVGLNVAAGQNITDLSGNPLPTAEPAIDQTYVMANNLCTQNVPEFTQYTMVYQLSIPLDADYNATWPAYSVNNTVSIPDGSFNRIGYCLELDSNWVWVSMDAFTTIATRTGVPVANTSAVFQQRIYNMNVNTNVTGVTTGTGITTGNIEFWHHCYEQATGLGGIGGSSTLYDFNDSTGTQPGSCYGSMQVHNYGTAQTIFAWNRWDYAGGGRMILASATPPADIQTGLSGTTQTATPPAP